MQLVELHLDAGGETTLLPSAPGVGLTDEELPVRHGGLDPCQPDVPVDPCRPAPWENVGEVIDPIDAQNLWIFDDNRFCAGGPGLACSRLSAGGELEDPNPGNALVDATDCVFEMYVVADCGTDMHLPLFDVESGCIRILDETREPIDFHVTNGVGFDEVGGPGGSDFVCWSAVHCDGAGRNDPGGPGNEVVMDVTWTRE
ncbi:MAG: hypothetical protein AAF533_30245, partial [Acidobacteriota bacterium]